jgi:hypothetical protein
VSRPSASPSTTPDAAITDDEAGATSDASTDSAEAGPSLPPLPTAKSAGGSVVKAPVIIPVLFSNDEALADVDKLFADAAKTTYWADQVAQYGVGAPTFGKTIHVAAPPAATLTDAAIRAWLAMQLDGSNPDFPTPSTSTVFVLVYPQGTAISLSGMTSCSAFHGYHKAVTAGGARVPFAVISRCAGIPEVTGLSGATYVAAVMSHEILEGLADPDPFDRPAYNDVDDEHRAWALATGGELGDLCALEGSAFFQPADFPYLVQKMWSNEAAKAGQDPCSPTAAGGSFFIAVPSLPDKVVLSIGNGSGVQIAAGGSRTIPVDVYSAGPSSGPITLQARARGSAGHIKLTFDRTTANPGDRVNLTIEMLAAATREEVFAVVATQGTRSETSWGVATQ